MQRKFNWTPVIMAIVAAFALWVYFAEYRATEKREMAKADATALVPFSISKVTGFSIHSSGFDTTLKKSGALWRVEKPYSDLADPAAVEAFLGMLSTEKIKDAVIEGPTINWKTYGLDVPVATLSMDAEVDGKLAKRSVVLGTVPAFDGSVYARIDGAARVDLVASTAQGALQKDPRDFRDKHFFPLAEHPELKSPEFKALEILRDGYPKLHFEKLKDTWTQKSAPASSWPLDQGAVKSYVDSLIGLRAADVWGENKKDAKVISARKLVRPSMTLLLISDKNLKYEAKFASLVKAEALAGGLSSLRPVVFSVHKAQIELFSKSLDDFRDLRFPFQFTVAELRAIELERPPGAVSLPVLLKKDGKWILDPAETRFSGREVRSDIVDQLIVEVSNLRAKSILPAMTPTPKLGPKNSVRIAMFGEKSKKLAEFFFNVEEDSVRVTSTVTPGKVFEIEKSQFDSLSIDVMTPPKEKR